MRLLKYTDTGELGLTANLTDDEIPKKYAILSHRWIEDEEVTFQEFNDGTGKLKPGYKKILFCGDQAARDDLHYFWVDTCCIDKSKDLTELQSAINSMFRWYRNATKCYVYLQDVSALGGSDNQSDDSWEEAFRRSEWFNRGWTLQELIAPESVEFFSNDGTRLGDKKSLERQVREITGIPASTLRGSPLSGFSVTERMSWSEKRQTKLVEDKAYSLQGIFDVCIPLLYGEGREKAFLRLREAIEKRNRGKPKTITDV
jgi:Heterokaryon incompatibility protein (HET)